MKPRHYSTAQVAREVGVHPNTVRMYEVWGFLPPIPRAPNGYRLYTEFHIDQMCLARKALHGGWPGRTAHVTRNPDQPSKEHESADDKQKAHRVRAGLSIR